MSRIAGHPLNSRLEGVSNKNDLFEMSSCPLGVENNLSIPWWMISGVKNVFFFDLANFLLVFGSWVLKCLSICEIVSNSLNPEAEIKINKNHFQKDIYSTDLHSREHSILFYYKNVQQA